MKRPLRPQTHRTNSVSRAGCGWQRLRPRMRRGRALIRAVGRGPIGTVYPGQSPSTRPERARASALKPSSLAASSLPGVPGRPQELSPPPTPTPCSAEGNTPFPQAPPSATCTWRGCFPVEPKDQSPSSYSESQLVRAGISHQSKS